MPLITAAQLQRAAPQGRPDIIAAIAAQADTILPKYGLTNLNRVRIFLSIPIEETGLWNLREDLQHYTAQRIHEVWRRVSVQQAMPLAHNARALAAYMYRHVNGNLSDDDAFNFRGGGLIQTTGRGNYASTAEATGIDLVGNPDLIADPAHALECAAALFVRYHDVLTFCDQGNSHAAWALVGSGRKDGQIINLANHELAYAHVCAAIPALGDIDVPPTPTVNQLDTRASPAQAPLVAGDVAGLQRALNELGFRAGPIDGLMSRVTEVAVVGFQHAAMHLLIDGVAGPETIAAINAALVAQAA